MKGLIFIPDISGFTNFVKSIDIDLGVSITSDLLNVIIDNNPLKLELSEIEGDAILFYKIGKPIPLKHVLSCFKNMYEAFDSTYRKWKIAYNLEADLSLKLIVHYGNIIVYDIKGFKKLYGETVIESHNLLKNGNGASEYVLVTEDYLHALPHDNTGKLLNPGYNTYKSQLSTGVKRIAYYFFSDNQKKTIISTMAQVSQRVLHDNLNLSYGI